MQRTLHGEWPRKIAAQYGITFQTVHKALKRTQQRVRRWAEEVSYAAAD
jgi:DNA-directed RNA polymerase specialized sigma24 family protein